jgi:uncharacterized protein (TIGR02147 family)
MPCRRILAGYSFRPPPLAAEPSFSQSELVTQRARTDVYRYQDYRAFLAEYYADRKANGRGFSYRAFSRRAGLASPNHLKRVIEGERNLSPEMAQRFAEACGLAGKEAQYFCELVEFNQARTSSEKQARYEALASHRGYRRAQKLDVAQAAYHGHWYVPAIRELAGSRGFRSDASWIAGQLLPAISVEQAEHALSVLTELGLLVKTVDGRLIQAQAVVSTGPETAGVHIVAYHQHMMQRAIASIDLVPKPSRDISSLTMRVSSRGLARIKQRVQEFRRELVGLESADALEPAGTEPDEIVVQLNLQLFPLTRLPSKPGDV